MIKRSEIDNIIVAGKSGAGKQPRIDVLTGEFSLEQLSTGNIFREYMGQFDASGYDGEISQFFDDNDPSGFVPDGEIEDAIRKATGAEGDLSGVVLGLKAKANINAGKFVPDTITNALFEKFFSRTGYKGMVLDGFPRTAEQARFLIDLSKEKGVSLDLIVLVENEDDLIVGRTVGRRLCSDCGKVYHIEFKPSKDNVHCDKCGGKLKQRSDDVEDRIRSRLQEFYDKVVPAMRILSEAGIPSVVVNGNLEVFTEENVRRSVMEQVQPLLDE